MTEAELRAKAIEGLACSIAHDNQGIYPQAVTGGDGAYDKRTEWMEGWNAAGSEFTDNVCKIEEYIASIPAEYKVLTEDLLLSGRLRLHAGEEVGMYVNCNDVFYWGCADAEPIAFEELQALAECCALSKFGDELWVCRKRGMRPQAASYRECYPREHWHLFDAAGPERDDPDGRGRATLA